MIYACAVCFGQSDSPMAQATNMGIFVMLGVVAVMLASFGAFIVYLARRARAAAADAGPADRAHRAVELLGRDPQEGTV